MHGNVRESLRLLKLLISNLETPTSGFASMTRLLLQDTVIDQPFFFFLRAVKLLFSQPVDR